MSLPIPSDRLGLGVAALLPLLILASAFALPVGAIHTAVERTCSGDYTYVVASGPGCATSTILCPASHGGFCAFTATVTVTGTGIVAAAVHQGAVTCAPSLNACTATHTYNVSPGLTSSTYCQVGTASVAVNVHLFCKLRG